MDIFQIYNLSAKIQAIPKEKKKSPKLNYTFLRRLMQELFIRMSWDLVSDLIRWGF